MAERRYFNIKELSEYTSIPVGSLYQLKHRKGLPVITLGKKLLFDREDIDEWLAGFKKSKDDWDFE